MFVESKGIKLFFDVAGGRDRLKARRGLPALVLLHGGPGAGSDHSYFRPHFDELSEIANVVYVDQRGHGQSHIGGPGDWCFNLWAEDVKTLCDALELDRPVVLGHSFGGFVAQAYAAKYPGHPSKLILAMTGARRNDAWSIEAFRARGGDAAAKAAEDFMRDPNLMTGFAYAAHCRPLLTLNAPQKELPSPAAVPNLELTLRFFHPEGEFAKTDLRPRLSRITAPALIVSGRHDPILPRPFQDELEAGLTSAPVHRVTLENTAHELADEWDVIGPALRRFILEN